MLTQGMCMLAGNSSSPKGLQLREM